MSGEQTELVLTCESWQEAQDLVDLLLSRGLTDSVEVFGSENDTKTQVKLILLADTKHFNKIKKAATINRSELVRV
jgi:hypothetical protein